MDNRLMAGPENLYYSYSSYLKKRYGKPAYRVAVDAGFSCPNRGKNRSGGCTYCDELGSTAVYHRGQEADLARNGSFINSGGEEGFDLAEYLYPPDMAGRKEKIRGQVENSTAFLKRRYGAEIFLLYFQAFSNTYAPWGELKEIYDYALSLADFSELIVSTRPDCIDREKTLLLRSYHERSDLDVWVELGLQSAHDLTLNRIRRGHGRQEFLEAFKMLRDAGIKITVHLIFGLPGENRKEIMETVDFIAELKPEGLKIHNLHVPVGTGLFREYSRGELTVPSGARHLEYTIEALERLPGDMIIHRLTCDTPSHRLGAPRNFYKKGTFLNILLREMKSRGSCQGRLYVPD